jgi:hypothetical protein
MVSAVSHAWARGQSGPWITAARPAPRIGITPTLPLVGGRMELQRKPPLALRLLPQAQGAFRIPAVGLSLGLHGGVVCLVLAGATQWASPKSTSIAARRIGGTAVTYVNITPSPDRHQAGGPTVGPVRTPAIPRPEHPSLTFHWLISPRPGRTCSPSGWPLARWCFAPAASKRRGQAHWPGSKLIVALPTIRRGQPGWQSSCPRLGMPVPSSAGPDISTVRRPPLRSR